jgi:hypothetical protein
MTKLRLCVVFALGAGLLGCGDDSATAATDAGRDAATPGGKDASAPAKDSGTPGKDGGLNPGKDASTGPGDAGDDAGGGSSETQKFKVPGAGGTFSVMTASGAIVKFEFPASAGGKAITATVVDASKLNWGNDGFAAAITDAIELGPDGATFVDPIKVTLPKKALFAFTWSTPGGVPNPLRLSADNSTLELSHFSTLGVVAPNQSCESQLGGPLGNGWSDVALSASCSSFGSKTTYRQYGCKNYSFCYTIQAGCCVAPGDPDVDCKVDDANITLVFNRANNGSQFPYCEGAGDTPYVQSVTPTSLVGNSTAQQIHLTGFGFKAGGTVFINTDQAISTQVGSDTDAYGIVPAGSLGAAGTLSNIGFVNKVDTAYTWSYRSNMVSLPITAPAPTCPVPEVGGSPIGVCTITSATDCSCAEDYNSGAGYHTYEIVCAGTVCECKRDSVLANDGAIGSACTDKASLQAMWTSLCAPAVGFCP